MGFPYLLPLFVAWEILPAFGTQYGDYAETEILSIDGQSLSL
jgi:hypothetical protein